MKIEEYIKLAQDKKEVNGVSVVKNEVLDSQPNPFGYEKSIRWTFSDGTVIIFDDETDNVPGFRLRNRSWKFEIIGSQVSCDSSVGVTSKY